jgi:hypothetical protein
MATPAQSVLNSKSATFPMTRQLAHLAEPVTVLPTHTSHELARHVVWRVTGHESRATSDELVCKTNPISKNPKINPTSFLTNSYGKMRALRPPKNEPKRTQTNPKQTQFFARQRPPKPKRTQTNPSRPNLSCRSLPATAKTDQARPIILALWVCGVYFT